MAQCKAHVKSTKKRCKKDAIKGGAVCHKHGGSAPQVRNAANMRILEMVNPALAQLKKLLTSKHAPTSLGAIKDVLDRAGLKPRDKLILEGSLDVTDPGRENFSDENLARAIAAAERLASAESA